MKARAEWMLLGALGLLGSACGGDDSAGDEVGESSESGSSDTESGDTESSDTESSDTESSDSTDTADTTTEDPPRPERLVVTADWRSKRLSLLDYALIAEGADTREAALWRELDMSAWEPGPLELALTPDGSAALVAISPGFFKGVVGNLIGAGTIPEGSALVLVNLESGAPIHEFTPLHSAMGVVITADGSTAWTANYGGNGSDDEGTSVSKLDLVAGTIELEFEVGPGPEQLDLSADESLAILNTAGDGSIRVFETADPEASLSPPLPTSEDSSWVLLLDDGRGFVANSLSPSSYSVVDIGDPSAPALLETVMVSGVPYAAQPIPGTTRILMTTTELQGGVHLYELELGAPGDASEIVRDLALPVAGFPLGFAYAADDELVLIPAPGDNALVVVELADESWRAIPWQDEVGPTYVVIEQ